jgi:phosphatidylserine/phosphatidylglycerophosphate/cardiolipin synthase-like enzyme
MSIDLAALHEPTSLSLRELLEEISSGAEHEALGLHRVQQIVGVDSAVAVSEAVSALIQSGWTRGQISLLLFNIIEARESATSPEGLLNVVLSGPEVPGVPTRDTAAVMHSIVVKANQEILLVGYAVYNGKKLFAPIAKRLDEKPDLRVRFVLNIPRKYNDTSLDSEIVRRFTQDFWKKHWPWEKRPELFYDPRALATNATQRASLHAKCLVVDREIALVTSANFTEAAQTKNIEAGVIVSYRPFVNRIADYFDGLVQLGPEHFGLRSC